MKTSINPKTDCENFTRKQSEQIDMLFYKLTIAKLNPSFVERADNYVILRHLNRIGGEEILLSIFSINGQLFHKEIVKFSVSLTR